MRCCCSCFLRNLLALFLFGRRYLRSWDRLWLRRSLQCFHHLDERAPSPSIIFNCADEFVSGSRFSVGPELWPLPTARAFASNSAPGEGIPCSLFCRCFCLGTSLGHCFRTDSRSIGFGCQFAFSIRCWM